MDCARISPGPIIEAGPLELVGRLVVAVVRVVAAVCESARVAFCAYSGGDAVGGNGVALLL